MTDMKKQQICIIGHFGGEKEHYDGQTIKTIITYDEFCKHIGYSVPKVDTFYKSERRIYLLVKSLFYIIKSKHIFILLSVNGLRFYLPILWIASKLLHKKIYHIVIGGDLHNDVKSHLKWIKYLNSFVVNWIETHITITELQKLGVVNAEFMPNFKNIQINETNNLVYFTEAPFKFCTFSRVSHEKGIAEAITAVEAINKQFGYNIALLDIYGKIDSDYEERFLSILENTSSAITYKGVVSHNESTTIMKNYHALLFPTFYVNEGIAGSLIDALFAGLPVIATDWNVNATVIEHKITGIIYSDNTNLKETLEWAIKNPTEINNMKVLCLEKAVDYLPDKHIKRIIERMHHVNVHREDNI